jgi:hypothetical protein
LELLAIFSPVLEREVYLGALISKRYPAPNTPGIHEVLTTTGFAAGQNSRRSATTRLNSHPSRLRKLLLLPMLQPTTSPPAKAGPALRQQITRTKVLGVSLAMVFAA